MKTKVALQFKIELLEISPIIWRTIQVSARYSFWDLHVAIQDSMGWLDYHIHEFKIKPPRKRNFISIGIPHNEYENKTLPGWETKVTDYLNEPGDFALYEYDFGDGWEHKVTLESKFLADDNVKYPICIKGERSCPPEDCGGVPGYYELIEILSDKKHERYEDMVYWLENHAKSYMPYKPEIFDSSSVEFWNPKKRFNMAFK
ncbi:plasmid pRiA4b ORF-3 family protein [Desulfosediminicola ganghwensis]|uniref:plasmid pRiA4b ORF-3 family protein n=1 Tax=Desulfosediminicola ganghwensis TaxID=2569540 RepID=UPI0010ABBC72|nr:plasmid pRiA4b ORF-3 family protein [Desulfosediminicola ganghwensis]